MKIGIDIDDVLTDTSKVMKEYIDKFDKTGEVKKNLVEVMRGEFSTAAIRKFMIDHIGSLQKNAKVKENARDVIQRLIDRKDEIIFITSRGEKQAKGSEKRTLEYLVANQIPYTKVIFNATDKAKVCKENNIDLMIDDSVKFCEEIQKEKTETIVFNSIVNQDIKTNRKRVNNWLELEEEIQKVRKDK